MRLKRMDDGVNAFTTVDSNGDYNVYVNSSLRYYERRAACRHEMAHIKNSHFIDSNKTILQIENEAG